MSPVNENFNLGIKAWADENSPNHATCSILVASHNTSWSDFLDVRGRYDLSPDVIDLDYEENFRGGSASFILVPRKPYTQFIFHGDHISIYLGTGAKHPNGFGVLGWGSAADDEHCVLKGTIDSIRETVSVDDSTGKVSVRIHVSTSPLQKSFERTQIYFNQNLSPASLFGSVLPGLADLTQGVGGGGLPLAGTPATIPRGIALAYLGFGGQCLLPESYPLQRSGTDERIRFLKDSLSRARALETALGLGEVRGTGKQPSRLGLVQQLARRNAENIQANSVLNLIDVFSRVEDFAVDGFVHRAPFHDLQGSVWGLMQENSNPMMNELFLSLLPTRKDDGSLSKEPDEWGKFPSYTPTLVLRERPFSSSRFVYRVPVSADRTTRDYFFGDVFFSSVLNKELVPRLQRSKANFNPTDPTKLGSFGYENRYVDRIQLRLKDIGSESIGMSDGDHFNFYTIGSTSLVLNSQDQKFQLLQDGLIPLFNEESIKRYGLRVRELQTKFMHTGGASIQSSSAMSFLIRSLLLQDHWYQLSPWHKAGSLTIRPLPEARVGMCVDIEYPRNETYYVEGVKQKWTLTERGGRLTTTLTVTRGQPSGYANEKERFWWGAPHVAKLFYTKSSTDLTAGKEFHRKKASKQPRPVEQQVYAGTKNYPRKAQDVTVQKVRQKASPQVLQAAEKIMDVTRYHETPYNKPPSYAYWTPNDAGAGVSFGFVQFNQKRGALPTLFQYYLKADSTRFNALFSSFGVNNLLNESWVRSANLNEPALRAAIESTGHETVFQRAQRDLALDLYYRPAIAIISKYVQLTERAACMAFDCCIQFGPDTTEGIFQNAVRRAKSANPNYTTLDVLREVAQISDVEKLRSFNEKLVAKGKRPIRRRLRILHNEWPAKNITDTLLSETTLEKYVEQRTSDGRIIETSSDGTSKTVQKVSTPPNVIELMQDRVDMGKPPWTLPTFVGKLWSSARNYLRKAVSLGSKGK